MSAKCNRKNPLVRNGTRQSDRALEALNTDYFKVDERSLEDLVVFAQRYSKNIRFYDELPGESQKNWSPFFSTDITAILASISKLPVNLFLSFSNTLQAYLEEETLLTDAQRANHFKLYFHLPFLLLKNMGEYIDLLPDDHGLRLSTHHLIARNLKINLETLIQFYKGAVQEFPSVFDESELDTSDYNIDFIEAAEATIQLPGAITDKIIGSERLPDLTLSKKLLNSATIPDWPQFYSDADPDPSPFTESSGDIHQRIFDALNYNILISNINKVYQTVQRVVEEVEPHFQASLNDKNDHEPHYGLWLTFLKLLKNNQNDLNKFTQRHLNYYYKDILQLPLRSARPDHAHLIMNLKKNVNDHLLEKGTLFKAGKDDDSNQVSYRLDEDIILNSAKVDRLMSLRLDKDHSKETLYASEIADSRDGKGESLPKESPHWNPFGPIAEDNHARVGFVIADRQLFLREGKRTIILEVTLKRPINIKPRALDDAFNVNLTAEEGWFEAKVKTKLSKKKNLLSFKITLSGEDPAIIPYDSNTHEGHFSTQYPIARIEFNFRNPAFHILKNVTVEALKLNVSVTGIKNITFQNENGLVDTSKPFLPFGPEPVGGSYFVLGSNELFSKKLESFHLDVQWKSVLKPGNTFLIKNKSDYKTRLHYLNGGVWETDQEDYKISIFGKADEDLDKPLIPSEENYKPGKFDKIGGAPKTFEERPFFERQAFLDYKLLDKAQEAIRPNDIFSEDDRTNNIGFGNPSHPVEKIKQTLENEIFSNESTVGFVKISLNTGFGHREYIDVNTLALMAVAKFPQQTVYSQMKNIEHYYDPTSQLPWKPYTPEIVDISLRYVSESHPPSQFFHSYPFGHDEPVKIDSLFPSFPNEGELYIGITDLKPPQRISLLFQTLQGTANPLKNEAVVQWQYLSGNKWENFQNHEVDDRTHNLSGTGIVRITIPEKADLSHDILPSGYHWLKLCVGEDTDAINDFLSINAQAVMVSFIDQDNSSNFLETRLPPGTISKLKISENAIQKIEQPNESFGGKPQEQENHYYGRVSERLRHKDRAVTIWDYEHLILERFPEIYRAKCINHTELCRDINKKIVAENGLKPGHVLIVPIPFINDKTLVNPLRPYTAKKLLLEIDDFLRSRISPFVQLEVVNPKFEEVQTQFKVTFKKNIADTGYFENLLNLSIIEFLTPWSQKQGGDIRFGGKWHKSAIVNFIEEQPYVDFVKDFEMYHNVDIDKKDNYERLDADFIEATSARSILVSHKQHCINENNHG